MDATALPPPASGGHWTGVEQLEKGCFLDPGTNTFRFREGLWDSGKMFFCQENAVSTGVSLFGVPALMNRGLWHGEFHQEKQQISG